MSTFLDYTNRQIVPRWHIYNNALHMGETQPVNTKSQPKLSAEMFYREKEADWSTYRELSYATDLVGTALMINDFNNPVVHQAAEFILKQKHRTSNIATEIAQRVLESRNIQNKQADLITESQKKLIYNRISVIKGFLRDYPYNPISWVDKAFYYAMLGQKRKVKYCIDVALNLGFENRFVLRSASRCLLHLGEADRALYILRKSELCKLVLSCASLCVQIRP